RVGPEIRLDASAIAAPTPLAAEADLGMTPLGGARVRAPVELPLGHDAEAHAAPEERDEGVTDTARGAEPQLGARLRLRAVLGENRQLGVEVARNRQRRPPEALCIERLLPRSTGLDDPGQAEADAENSRPALGIARTQRGDRLA